MSTFLVFQFFSFSVYCVRTQSTSSNLDYDPDNQNWFWAKYLPNGSLDKNPKGMQLAGRVAKGADAGCIACHAGADGGDYMFLKNEM